MAKCPFQALFHHIFLRGMEDIAQSVNTTGAYSLEFEPHGTHCVLSIRYWKSDYLVKVQLNRYLSTSDPNPSQLQLVSQLISFLSTEPQMTCLSGCTSEVLQTIEQASIFKKGVEYPFRSKTLSLLQIMHQKEGCVFGRIDFYTQLKYLIAFLSNSLDEPWMVNCPELTKVWEVAIFIFTHRFRSDSPTLFSSSGHNQLRFADSFSSHPLFRDHYKLAFVPRPYHQHCSQLRNDWS